MSDNKEALPVARYTVETVDRYDMEESPTGMWCLYEDVTAALSELRAEVERYKADAERWQLVRNRSIHKAREIGGAMFWLISGTVGFDGFENTPEEREALDKFADEQIAAVARRSEG